MTILDVVPICIRSTLKEAPEQTESVLKLRMEAADVVLASYGFGGMVLVEVESWKVGAHKDALTCLLSFEDPFLSGGAPLNCRFTVEFENTPSARVHRAYPNLFGLIDARS